MGSGPPRVTSSGGGWLYRNESLFFVAELQKKHWTNDDLEGGEAVNGDDD